MILTTHYMEEAAFLCDYIIIMDHGVVLKEGTMSQLLGDDKSGKIKTLDDLFVSLTGRTINETV
jgi:ABC-type multidrug transport system ATPase subunit